MPVTVVAWPMRESLVQPHLDTPISDPGTAETLGLQRQRQIHANVFAISCFRFTRDDVVGDLNGLVGRLQRLSTSLGVTAARF